MTAPGISAARLLGAFEPGSREWEEARSGRVVTATDVAAIVGLSPWMSPFSLWHHKAGTVRADSAPNTAMSWGSRLEPVIAEAFADAHSDLVVHATGTWENGVRPWQRATPDRLLTPAPGGHPSVLEIKTSRYGEGFGEPGTDEVPVYYRCQVLWQLDTLGLEAAHIAVLIGGQDYREYLVRYDEDEAVFLREQAAAFLAGIESGTPPPLDGHAATYRTAQRLPGGVEEVVADISPAVAEAYRAALLDYRRAEEAKREASSAVLAAMGPAKKCQASGRLVATRTVREDGTTRSLIPHPSYVKAATA
ncbi:YqaJ viral recombinase family protein [Streptomyces yunnanensis]|uniref:YqaJ viral recombinase family protein n=1 Tax=Streptomyces yunnanensis TaxID=156453 RepID=A0ABY8AC76_9ACTN|nr:YqaJ viral recombinase family protein [Streptomyces yunnanensis]WEB41535.1 YqaJ viral recombinase family protein [Streptomyces yunnanensis]